MIILTSIEPYPNKLDNHATFQSSMEWEMKHIFQSMPLLFCTLLGNMKKYSCRVEKIMPDMEIPEEKCFSIHLGRTNVPVGWNNYTRHGNLREFFSTEKIVLENGKKIMKIRIQPLFLDHPYIN